VVRADRVGKDGGTVRAFLEGEGGGPRLKAICFRAKDGPLAQALLGGGTLHLAGHLRAESWNDNVTACLHVVDAAPLA
jgi:single-stranded-DNA-specific exonuclease